MAEGPTGAFADMFGRAWAVAASFYCRALAVAIVIAIALFASTGMAWPVRALCGAAIVLAQVLLATAEAALEGVVSKAPVGRPLKILFVCTGNGPWQ